MSRTPNIFSPTTPDPNTPEGQALLEAREKFFGAIGKLIGTFAVLESALFALLGTLSQVPKPIALALFADQRVDGAMTAIRRVLAARQKLLGKTDFEVRAQKLLDTVLSQIAAINKVRNHLIHHGTMGSEFDDPIASNWPRARSEEQLTEIPVSPTALEQMLQDIGTGVVIIGYLTAAATTTIQASHLLPLAEKHLEEHPWQYKSPLQGGKKGNTQKTSQRRSHPPQSSEA